MTAKFGMGSTLFVRDPKDPEVIREAEEIIKICYDETKKLLKKRAADVHRLTEELVKKETLSKDEIDAILERQLAKV